MQLESAVGEAQYSPVEKIERIVEWEAVDRFCTLLGRKDERRVFAIYPPEKGKPCIHYSVNKHLTFDDGLEIERRLEKNRSEGYSLGMVINRCGPISPDWGTKLEHFRGHREEDQQYKYDVWNKRVEPKTEHDGFRCRPRVFGAQNDDIQESVAVWFECDGDLSLEDQERLHRLIGLPEPTFSVWTGGKSLHNYYVLLVAIDKRRAEQLMLWMCKAIKAACPSADPDFSIKSPSRVMRVPGGLHGATGRRVTIHREHPDLKKYTAEELEAALPETARPQQKAPKRSASQSVTGTPDQHLWFSQLSPEDQREEALQMLAVLPCRQLPSDKGGPRGTRSPALRVLGGLATQFGDDVAVEICHQAGWFNEWWDPAEELRSFTHTDLTIGSVIRAAKDNGYLTPQMRKDAELLDRLENMAGIADLTRKSPEGSWVETFNWMLDKSRTIEVLVEEALYQEAAESGSEWLMHQESFRRYVPEQGYFERVSRVDMERRISQYLRRVYEIDGKEIRRTQTTAAKATACANWMATTLSVEEMDTTVALAFTNGTVYPDGDSWRLGDHSSANRLTFCIAGEWHDNAPCPPVFREFVRTSYGLEWLEILRAVLCYFADPRHGCRVFLVLLGQSGTGKGTLERLIEKMYPKDAVAICQKTQDLSSPERVAQLVMGRRLLAFPDLQGHQSDLGTLYTLTEGGTLTGRHLYARETIEFVWRGRVVMCSTQPPSFDNAGTGFARRILTIPTLASVLPSDLLSSNPQQLDEALHAELGQIVSWALQMPPQDVEQVLRRRDPAGLLRDAADEMEASLDATRSFIDRCLCPAESTNVPVFEELFFAYRLFCSATGHKGVCNESNFKGRLRGALTHLHRERKGVPGRASAAKTPALFYGFQLNPGLWHKSAEEAHRYFVEHQQNGKGSGYGIYGGDNPEIEKAPSGSNWGSLLRTRLREGGYALLKRHRPPEPTYEQLVEAKVIAS